MDGLEFRPRYRNVRLESFRDDDGDVMIGNHVRLEKAIFSGKPKFLTEYGLRPGDMICVLHIDKNLPKLSPITKVGSFTRYLIESVSSSLFSLGVYCKRDHPYFKNVKFFAGYSRLVRNTAKKYGFTVIDIDGGNTSFIQRKKARGIVAEVVSENLSWKKYQKTMKNPKYALISRQKLISHLPHFYDSI